MELKGTSDYQNTLKTKQKKQKQVCKNVFRTDFFLFLSVECLVY